MANQSLAHNHLKNEIILKFGCDPQVLIWNNPTGVFRGMESYETITKVGTKGQADILAVIAPSGVLLGIEVKTGKGSQRQEQKDWENALKRRGGFYVVARSIDDVTNAINYLKKRIVQ
jgi:hypothetical protein